MGWCGATAEKEQFWNRRGLDQLVRFAPSGHNVGDPLPPLYTQELMAARASQVGIDQEHSRSHLGQDDSGIDRGYRLPLTVYRTGKEECLRRFFSAGQ